VGIGEERPRAGECGDDPRQIGFRSGRERGIYRRSHPPERRSEVPIARRVAVLRGGTERDAFARGRGRGADRPGVHGAEGRRQSDQGGSRAAWVAAGEHPVQGVLAEILQQQESGGAIAAVQTGCHRRVGREATEQCEARPLIVQQPGRGAR